MAKIKCTVVNSICVDIDFDCSKIMDEEYIEQKKRKIKEMAAELMECDTDNLTIHDSELPVLIE